MFTISSENINKQLNTQSYNTVLSNYAQISTLLEIACATIVRWLFLSQLLRVWWGGPVVSFARRRYVLSLRRVVCRWSWGLELSSKHQCGEQSFVDV